MVKINEFAVEQWMDDHENDAKHNLAETCCASVSIDDLVALSGQGASANIIDSSQKLTYGAIPGSTSLRSRIADLYSRGAVEPLSHENVLVTNGAIQANFLALFTCVGAGDHVICHYPTYQQLYSLPASFGAEVSLWKAKEEDEWRLSLDELKSMIKPNTKLIILNNPQNPTGAVQPRQFLQHVVDIARKHDITIHCDEVYRPLFHACETNELESPPSILSFDYDKTVSTGSMSKAFSLAGIRVGWIASRSPEIIRACSSSRHYTTISVSQIDDQIATFALSQPTVDALLYRNMELARGNIAILGKFVAKHSWACQWVVPRAGTTALIKFVDKQGRCLDDAEFCKRLQAKTGVMLVPASVCFGEGVDFRGYVRIGYVPEQQVLIDGLRALEQFMLDGYESMPLANV
ncbi:putative aminotransferase [Xylariales sp. PMI_506]|nr:putative aminotransferase [Xylariales sp. PMI_506]